MAGELRVRNWQRFQHYRNRNPPWIKLHYELISSRDWVALDDASRVLAIACMLLASRNDGLVPADPEYVRRVAYLHEPPDFGPLIACGFLVGDASSVQASASNMHTNARPETEREKERKREARTARPHTNGRSSKGTTLPIDWQPSHNDVTYAATRGLLGQQLTDEVEKFRNYWTAKSGRDACKRDWHATWRNWVLNSKRGGKPVTRELWMGGDVK